MAKANSTRKTTSAPSAADSNSKTRTPKDATPEPEVFGPAITVEQVGDLEDSATTEARGQQRRIMLLMMSKGAEDTAKISVENPDVYREMREMTHVFLHHARSLAEFAQVAVARLMVADLREDTSKEDAEATALLNEGGAA